MKHLTVKLKVNDNVEAYQIVSRLGFKFQVEEASLDNRNYKFSKSKNKMPKYFLRDDFGKKDE